MKFLGIDFVPLNEPLHARLETFWAGFWFLTFVFGSIAFSVPFIYLLFTPYWWVTLAMLTWIYFDKATCEKGGRPNQWVRNWKNWQHMKAYYNPQLLQDEGFNLDSNQNYIFAAFPHGTIPMGPYTCLQLESCPFQKQYPKFLVKLAVINLNFQIPILRELMMSMGFVSCSYNSFDYLFGRPEKGKVVVLMVGGAEEALKTEPGKYKFVIKNRKGFVKVALKFGTPIVPVITFGETLLFEHIDNPILRKFQLFVKRHFGFVPVLFNGRGLFQKTFGIFPRKTQLVTVMGKPIQVSKVENPTKELIDEFHSTFVTHLAELFEKFKHHCVENPENVHLELF